MAGILLNSLFATTPNTDSWHKIAPMPIGVFFASGSQVNHQYVVTGGVTGNGPTGSAIQVLNLDTLTWEIAGQLPTDRFAHAQCTLADGRILIASGRSGNLADMPSLTWLKDAWLWDSTTHQFTPLPDLSRKSRGPSAHTLPNGQTVVITEDTAHLLSADATQWEALIQLKATRIDHDAVAVTDH
ncbi:MAG: hypothetical protein JKX85_04250, partial [Phycisphaeraceae bacterium]|nr:hypothetical protein [Phycisphaeraceae bacterium]